MEAFLSISLNELRQRVLAQHDFRKSKVTRLALVIYLISFLSAELPLLLTDCECTGDLPTFLYILRLVFVAIAFVILIFNGAESFSYRHYEDFLKVLVFTGILFTTSFNFSQSQESRSKFYGINVFWEGMDISFYLVIVTIFVIKKWWFRGSFLAINLTLAIISKNITNRDLFYIIKIVGIIAVCTLLMYSLERDFKLLYLRKMHYKQEEQAWRRLVDVLPEGVLIINTNKEIMFYNKGISEFIPANENKKTFEKQLSKLTQEIHQLKCRDHIPNYNFEIVPSDSGFKEPRQTEGPPPLALSGKASGFNTKVTTMQDEREETTYNYTLWTQVNYFLQNYKDCKEKTFNMHKSETNFITFEGSYKDRILEIKIAFSPFDYQDCLIVVLRDMSDRNTIALLEANDKYKSLILASVSHELRTPLSNTFNMVTFASESEETPSEIKSQFLQPALISLKMLLGLVNDILDYSQINENKFRLVYQDIDLKKLLEETCGLMLIQTTKKGLQLFTEIDERIPSPFHTDPNRLSQIMLNLLSNAMKFTLKGYIKVKAKFRDENDGLVEVSVEDTGIGISPEDQAKLFQNYTKIDIQEKAKLNASGCGLGLAISNTLAKALARGEQDPIQVVSEPGLGSKFSFFVQNKAHEFSAKSKMRSFEELKSPTSRNQKGLISRISDQPQQKSEDFIALHLDERVTRKRNEHQGLAKSIVEYYRTSLDVSTPGQSIEIQKSPKYPKYKKSNFERLDILIVDDDSFNILSLETILKSLGYTFTHAYNGKEAIDKVLERNKDKNKASFKLIFMDCNMPIMDGFEASKLLKQKMKDEEISYIPIIGCTAYNHEESIKMCLDNEMDGVICKPANKAKIEDVIKKFIIREQILKNTES